MSPEQWRRVKDLYNAALDTPRERRYNFVQEHASDDTIVASELQRLLEIDPDETAAIDKPAGSLTAFLAPAISPGDHIANRYRILGEVGQGGMGQVYEATDEDLKTRVALKIIRPELAAEPRVIARFKQEVQLARQVSHPNVCRAYDLVKVQHKDREILILVMEFVDGETLSTKLRRDGKMKVAEAEPIIRQIAAGLDAAHTAGVVHRDLKSGNVFLSKTRDGELRVVLADFGLAGHLTPQEAASRQTTTGWGIGTPAYMAPEQVEGGKIGPAADIYALGVVMYEMATGQVPYEGQTPLQVAVRRLREKPRPPRELDSSIDGKWETAILRCLEIEPADRFATAGEAAKALHQLRWLPRTPNRLWRRRIGAAAAVAILAAGAGVYWGRSRTPNVPPEALSWYNRGLSVLYDGNWPDAEKAFTQAIQAAPSFGAAYARRAEAQIEMQRVDDARASLLEGVGAGLFTPEQKLHSEAMLAYVNRKKKETVRLLEERLKVASPAEHTMVRYDLANVRGRLGEWKSAIKPYEEVVARDPGNTIAWIQLGRAYAGSRDPAASRRSFDRAESNLSQFPDPDRSVDLAFFRASAANYLGSKEARSLAEQALEMTRTRPVDFRSVRARFLLAEVLGKYGDEPATAETLIRDAQRDATSLKLDFLLAKSFFDLGNVKNAQSQLEDSIHLYREAMVAAKKASASRIHSLARIELASRLGIRKNGNDLQEAASIIQAVIQETSGAELADIRLDARVTAARIAGVRDLAEQERLLLELVQDAKSQGDSSYVALGLSSLADVSKRRLRLVEAETRLRQAIGLVPAADNSVLPWRYARELASTTFLLGDYDAALRQIAESRARLAAAPKSAILEERSLSLDRLEASIKSEQGRSAEALEILRRVELRSKELRSASLQDAARRARCQVEAEAHRLDLALQTCGALLQELAAQKSDPANSALLQRGLAQAYFWAGRYREAARMALQARAARQGDRIYEWSSTLTLAAAQRRLGEPSAGLLGELRHFVQDFEAANGKAARDKFLNRRPFRELLPEAGFPPN